MDKEKVHLLDDGGKGRTNKNYGSPNENYNARSKNCTSPTQLSSISPTIDTSSRRRSSIAAMAAAAEIQLQRRNTLDRAQVKNIPKPLIEVPSIESLEADDFVQKRINAERLSSSRSTSTHSKEKKDDNETTILSCILGQLPAIIIVSILNFMVGIPFGASYFPTELSLQGKEVLGLRMFLFSTIVAQFIFTYKSKFTNGIGLQMVENVPFCLELARIVMDETKSDDYVVPTLFFLFALSSVIVGLVFYLLGRFELGRVVYFFPSHVLVGCIGGIGLFIIVTSMEVSTNSTFSFTAQGIDECILQNLNLLGPVILFELILRLLMHLTSKNGEQQYPLLGPIYYCFITPVFYAMLWITNTSIETAEEMGYFFPPLSASGSVFNEDLYDIFTEIKPNYISWNAVIKSIPTMISLTAFSLIHVPINIPAFAISTNTEPDMNVELIAHGWSNFISGICGGLQNYMTYSNSVIYYKSKGNGKLSSLAIVAATIIIFIYGPSIASYVPRCMAGTLLLHVGIDLVIEGVIESYEDYDWLEYSGILLICCTMVIGGMDAALVAGIIAALSTFLVQSMVYQDPIRGVVNGARLRSSAWNRSAETQRILLNCETGRARILVIQMQGHIFFGNSVKLTDDIKKIFTNKKTSNDEPAVVILDFTSVLGMDSSASQSIAKLKSFVLKNFNVEIILFVTGHEDGFLCTYNLSSKVADENHRKSIHIVEHTSEQEPEHHHHDHRLSLAAGALQAYIETESKSSLIAEIPNSQVCETLDDALIFAEDVLIALSDPSLLKTDSNERFPMMRTSSSNINEVKAILETLCPSASSTDIDMLFDLLSIEEYNSGDIIWKQGDESTSMKIIVDGKLISMLDDEIGASETICPGSTIGELGIVNGIHRLTTVRVVESATLYSLSKENWHVLTEHHPKVARCIDLLVIRYLSHRVQHVSNGNICGGRSLPV